MAQLFHIDNETPDLGDWTGSYIETYGAVVQSEAAKLPGSAGTLGLRVTGPGSTLAYVYKTVGELAAGETRYVGCFLKVPVVAGQDTHVSAVGLSAGANLIGFLDLDNANRLFLLWYTDLGNIVPGHKTYYLTPGNWYYLVLMVKRATTADAGDGQAAYYINGELVWATWEVPEGIDNYHRCAGAGQCQYGRVMAMDFDEILDMDEMYGSDNVYPTPESDPSGGYYDIFRGIASPAAIDWVSPVASIPAGTGQAVLAGLGHEIGVQYWYGIRTVSEAGIEECGTQAVACVELDAEGQLLSPPLARPEELTVRLTREGMILLGFSHQVPPGYAAAELFDVFSDGGSGELDLQTPLATVPNAPGRASDHEVCLPAIEFPLKLAVRARSGQRTGPLSSVITVAVEEPSPAIVLSM
jgi:hypothetical protein